MIHLLGIERLSTILVFMVRPQRWHGSLAHVLSARYNGGDVTDQALVYRQVRNTSVVYLGGIIVLKGLAQGEKVMLSEAR